MPLSKALENSARNFCDKYACQFDFSAFESSVEEFTFLRPDGGWIDVYKMMFDRVYQAALEKVAAGAVDDLDGEAMLDDFEYTLIRPYVNESRGEIKHRPYVGMDRISRLEYLDQLTKAAPANLVDLCAEKYKRGELSIQQMCRQAESATGAEAAEPVHYVEIAGYIQALEATNRGRSALWRALHPLRNNAERRDAALMKRTMIRAVAGGEASYREIAASAYAPFEGHRRVQGHLERSMTHAREEMHRLQKLNDVKRESLRVEGFDGEPLRERSLPVDQHTSPVREPQI